jgi:hypothetical protein
MIMLEEGTFATTTGAASLYLPEIAANTPNPLRATMTTIITQWSNATGRPMKAPQTEVVPAAGAMRTVAQAPATAAATSPTNGSQAVSVG